MIQGPPGTGKSQTITNLIADFVARGKRVLFVCQKRAALDVVHARLASQRLDGLCALIHDSQADKKAFVHGLRDTYESWLSADDDFDALETRRAELVARIDRLLSTVEAFEHQLTAGAPPLRELINRLAELHAHAWRPTEASVAPASPVRPVVPGVAEWWGVRDAVREAARELASADPATGGVLARSSLAFIATKHWDDADVTIPARELRTRWDAVATALAALDEPAAPAADAGGAGRVGLLVGEVRGFARLGRVVEPLAGVDRVEAIVPRSAVARELAAAGDERKRLVVAEGTAWKEAAGWSDPLAPADARAALKVAQGKEGGVFSFLSGDWRRVKSLVRSRFDSTDRAVQPSITDTLTDLVAAYSASAAVQEHVVQTRREWAVDDPGELIDELAAARKAVPDWQFVLRDGAPAELARLADALDQAEESTQDLLADHWDTLTVDELRALADRLIAESPVVRAVGPKLRDLADAPPAVLTALRQLDASPDQLEYAVCAAEWERARAAAPCNSPPPGSTRSSANSAWCTTT